MGYEMIIKSIDLTADEIGILKDILEHFQETACRTDEMVIETLLEKLDL